MARRLPGLKGAGRVLGALAYAFWVSGLRPFSAVAYFAIGLPSLLVLIAYARLGGLSRSATVAARYRRLAGAVSFRAALPWSVVLFAGVFLEVVGLARGGRSRAVPTLSTELDRLLAWSALRVLLFCGWLWLGVRAVVGGSLGRD